ncbi:MAG: MaoC family dehydratase N-terminal domain-containing protein [Thermoflexaceae bacterium]|nr:MaoC family dehydratase N-terminal domain-containing protein [Thermoflexaceae bacterium]
MPIDPNAVGAAIAGGSFTWDRDRIILYHLGLGAGNPQTDANELAYTYEKNLKVLPSWGVIPAFGAMGNLGSLPGMQFNPALLLHGEQDLEIHRAIPVAATVNTSGKVAGIYDKGKAALVVLEMTSKDEAGNPLFTNRFSLFIRGEGGWGGESGPKPGNEKPERDPDLVVESRTLPQQALLYRLSGDKNPLHADPEFSKLGGFDVPILHGLCSYGVVCKAVVDNLLGGDTGKVARYQARFAGVVFPGETIVTAMWKEGNTILIDAKVKERGLNVISNAAITTR